MPNNNCNTISANEVSEEQLQQLIEGGASAEEIAQYVGLPPQLSSGNSITTIDPTTASRREVLQNQLCNVVRLTALAEDDYARYGVGQKSDPQGSKGKTLTSFVNIIKDLVAQIEKVEDPNERFDELRPVIDFIFENLAVELTKIVGENDSDKLGSVLDEAYISLLQQMAAVMKADFVQS